MSPEYAQLWSATIQGAATLSAAAFVAVFAGRQYRKQKALELRIEWHKAIFEKIALCQHAVIIASTTKNEQDEKSAVHELATLRTQVGQAKMFASAEGAQEVLAFSLVFVQHTEESFADGTEQPAQVFFERILPELQTIEAILADDVRKQLRIEPLRNARQLKRFIKAKHPELEPYMNQLLADAANEDSED